MNLCGTRVERATLHNQDFIDSLDIRIGDTIRVYKSGDIIPKVSGVDISKRPSYSTKYNIPENCPACGEKLEREKNAADFRCVNPNCPAQLESHLLNFVGRGAMDIKGLGESAILQLIAEDFIKNIADIYKLRYRREELIAKKILGLAKNTDKVLAAIEESKKNSPVKLLTGLGIFGVGSSAARDLIRHFGGIEELSSASVEELLNIPDIGEITAKHIEKFFADEKNIRLLDELKNLGLIFKEEISQKENSSNIAGKIFVLTGTLEKYSRNDAAKLIEDRGGIVKNSVSKKIDYVIAGESAGSKLTKANDLGIKILDENDFEKLVGEV